MSAGSHAQDTGRQMAIPVYSHRAGPFDDAGNVVCYKHQLVAVLRESKTDKNPEREFYSCSKPRSDPDRCNFFLWADELVMSTVPDEEAELGAQNPSTPSTWSESPKYSSYAPYLPSSSPAEPSLSLDSSIYASHIDTGSDFEGDSYWQYRAAQKSQADKRSYDDSDQPLLEDPAGPSCSRTLEDEDGQHTRSSSGSLSASLRKRVVPDEPDTIAGSSPPSSYKPWCAPATGSDECLRRDTCNHPNDLLRSIDRYTGKSTKRRTANSPPRRDTKRSVGIAPFVRPQSDVVRDLSSIRSQQHTVQGPSITPSADSVAAHLEALAGMPAYIRKLERKQIASEKSIRVKMKRIAELEGKIQCLQAENAQLRANLELDPRH